jgi:hypothetical protein
MMNALRERDQEVADQLRQITRQADSIESVLTTNDRVIARVTDGIYRQPGSAIRELIANAYDADATWVSVKTDAPEFSRITIEDNGTGMTPDTVIHLLHNIGGSAKRTGSSVERERSMLQSGPRCSSCSATGGYRRWIRGQARRGRTSPGPCS